MYTHPHTHTYIYSLKYSIYLSVKYDNGDVNLVTSLSIVSK